MLTLQQIIDEADVIVPNGYTDADKISWLNHINQEFFNVVKIPKVHTFTTTTADEYTLPNDVRAKNIDLLEVGLIKYRNLLKEDVNPTENFFTFDDTTFKLTLSPVPYKTGLKGIVRYQRIATTTFTTSSLNANPDAPAEYHWTYVPALCEQICLATDDGVKAANFAQQYLSAWNAAAQNYQQMLTPMGR